MSVERNAPASPGTAGALINGLGELAAGTIVAASDPELHAELGEVVSLVLPDAALVELRRMGEPPSGWDGSAPLLVLSRAATSVDIRALVEAIAGWARIDTVRVAAGLLVIPIAGPAPDGAAPPEIDTEALLVEMLAQIRRIVHSDARAFDRERRALSERVDQLAVADRAERDQLRAAHRRDIAKVKGSARYQIGDIIITGVRRPRSLRRLPSRVRALRAQARAGAMANDERPLPKVEPRRELKVGAILDEFSWDCFAHEARLIELDPERLPEQLAADPPELVFVESAWQGNRRRWRYTINRYGEREPNRVRELLDWAEQHHVPAVFWNKEDPVNYEVFIEAARQFPSVLTTDADIIDRYRSDLGHDRVAALPFAAQPTIHNPMGRPDRVRAKACFAGAWRGDKYDGRKRDFELLLNPLLANGLVDIYDRYADDPRRDELGFPEPYRRAVLGSLPYAQMVQEYRNYAAFLNVNSVDQSPTMFSRRVFELLACGTPVISTWSRGIEEMLGEHVYMPTSPAETLGLVEMLVSDDDARERRGHLGYRFVHRHHTYRQRFAEVLTAGGLPEVDPGPPLVTVISVSNRPEQLDHALHSYTRQTYRPTELVFVANSSGFDRELVERRVGEIPGARALFIDDSATLADCLNEAMAIADGDYIAKFDDDDDYGDEYLADMMLTFEYSGAKIAGKRSYYAYVHELDRTVLRFPGREHSRVKLVVGGTLVFDRRATDAAGIRFTPVERGTDTIFLEDCLAAGLRIHSADRFNFVQHRHADVGRHTWKIDVDQFLEKTSHVASGYAADRIFL